MKPIVIFCFVAFFVSGCGLSIKPEQLYGRWKYVKVEKLNTSSPELLPEYELAAQSPYIEFTANNDFKIVWGGETLSFGKFKAEGNKIQVTENLPGGKVRQFPFLVSSLEGRNMVFETTTQGGSRVTAVKEQSR